MDNQKNVIHTGKKIIAVILLVLFILSTAVLAAAKYRDILFPAEKGKIQSDTIVVADSETDWQYLDSGEMPGAGNAWTQTEYRVQDWKEGHGPFTMDTSDSSLQGGTLLLDGGEGSSPSMFFRYVFRLDRNDLKKIQSMEGTISYSDSALVYLNGEIIFAGNVPDGGYSSNIAVGNAEETEAILTNEFQITETQFLREGINVLSVELHRQSLSSKSLYMDFSRFVLLNSEAEETAPDVSSAVLEEGEDDSSVIVNWMSASSGYYAVKYMDADQYRKDPSIFEQKSAKVLMGRRDSMNTAVHRATLRFLKASTQYVYCISRIGSIRHSDMLYFTTPGITSVSFAVLGDPQLGAYGKDDQSLWNHNMQLLTEQEFPEHLFVMGDLADNAVSYEESLHSYFAFRQPSLFKQVPLVCVKGNHDAAGEAETLFDLQYKEGDYSFICQNVLFMVIDSNLTDIQVHKKFLADTIAASDRKWKIVLMHHSIFSSGEHTEQLESMRSDFSALFSAMDIDLVISGHDHIYSRSFLMKGETVMPDQSDAQDTFSKETGETLYISSGSSSGNKFYKDPEAAEPYEAKMWTEKKAIYLSGTVYNSSIEIQASEMDNGETIDKIILQK